MDPRVELVSIVFYLSGGRAYNQSAQYGPYRERVDRWFSRFKDHPAVRYAARLRDRSGIGFDAPMSLAVHIDPDSLRPLVPLKPWPRRLDDRWTPHTVRVFLKRLRAFRRDSGFDAVYRDNLPFYRPVTARLGDVVDRELHLEWFPAFFGTNLRREDTLHIVAGLLLGGCNYAPTAVVGGRRHRYAIIGVWRTDEKGEPTFRPDDMETVVHEFCHSFANPVVRP